MSDTQRKWHEMQEENDYEIENYIFVLDYFDGKIYRYDISSLSNKENKWNPGFESCESFLIGAGHTISNIEWMATKEKDIEYGN